MKKLLPLVLLGCLFSAATAVQAEAPRRKPADDAAAQMPAITRSAQDPSTLTLFGKDYVFSSSEENDSAENMWSNTYALNADEDAEEIIQISKVSGTTCQKLLEDGKDDPDDFLTLDQRNPNNILFSQMDDETYIVGRMVQVGNDVFMLMMVVAQPAQEQDLPQSQAQRKQIFSAVRNTSANVIAEHFVQAVCRLGSDCRL